MEVIIYLGLRTLFTREAGHPTVSSQPQTLRRIFAQGVAVAMLNPKTALFFVAFLPQFVDPSHGAIAGQMLVLGCIFVMLTVISDSMYALLAGTAGRWLEGSRSIVRAERYVVGSVYRTGRDGGICRRTQAVNWSPAFLQRPKRLARCVVRT